MKTTKSVGNMFAYILLESKDCIFKADLKCDPVTLYQIGYPCKH